MTLETEQKIDCLSIEENDNSIGVSSTNGDFNQSFQQFESLNSTRFDDLKESCSPFSRTSPLSNTLLDLEKRTKPLTSLTQKNVDAFNKENIRPNTSLADMSVPNATTKKSGTLPTKKTLGPALRVTSENQPTRQMSRLAEKALASRGIRNLLENQYLNQHIPSL
jgi:hypothetical protein